MKGDLDTLGINIEIKGFLQLSLELWRGKTDICKGILGKSCHKERDFLRGLPKYSTLLYKNQSSVVYA